jgi:sugar lactone lactonase YvrE
LVTLSIDTTHTSSYVRIIYSSDLSATLGVSRFGDGVAPPQPREGWTCLRLTAPSRLYGANGVTIGPDDRLYVAQFMGNRVSAISIDDAGHEVIVPFGGPVAAPDDTTFDSRGTMYITDTMPGSVWAREPNGDLRTIAGDLPSANGITCHADRVFVNENRDGGRLLEVYPDGRAPRVLLKDLPHPNAMSVGPDGLLYFPLIGGEIWRVPLDGCTEAERFIDGLIVPPAAKFDATGRLVTISSITGEVLGVDLQSRKRTLIATLAPGLDNVACHPDGRMFTSHFISGQITAVGPGGDQQVVSPPGLIGPTGVAVTAAGQIIVADFLGLISVGADGALATMATLLDAGFPGVIRGLTRGPRALYMTTSGGSVVSYDLEQRTSTTIADGYRELMGLAVGVDGTVFVAAAGDGRVIRISADGVTETVADGLGRPTGVAISDAGVCFVTDAETGQILSVGGDGAIAGDGFQSPQGIAAVGDTLYVLDADAKQLVALHPGSGERQIICDALPIGDPSGTRHTPLCGDALVPGPLSGMCDLAVGGDGDLYVAANGDGSVIKLARTR